MLTKYTFNVIMSNTRQFGKLAADYIRNQMRCKGALKGNTALNIRNILAAFAVFSLVAWGSGTPQQLPLALAKKQSANRFRRRSEA
jgi:hypothetical protein